MQILFGDSAAGLAFGGSNEVFITGTTTSTDFPTHGTQVDACRATGSAFLSEINVATPAVTYSTCLGGTTEDVGNAIALGATNLAYLTGQTFSADFPTVPAGNTIPAPVGFPNVNESVAFVSVINSSTGALTYSTLLGGNNGDVGNAIAVDSSGNAYVTGYHRLRPYLPHNPGRLPNFNNKLAGTSFITELNPAGANADAQLLYSTYSWEAAKAVATLHPRRIRDWASRCRQATSMWMARQERLIFQPPAEPTKPRSTPSPAKPMLSPQNSR